MIVRACVWPVTQQRNYKCYSSNPQQRNISINKSTNSFIFLISRLESRAIDTSSSKYNSRLSMRRAAMRRAAKQENTFGKHKINYDVHNFIGSDWFHSKSNRIYIDFHLILINGRVKHWPWPLDAAHKWRTPFWTSDCMQVIWNIRSAR